jgi:hypothetical protein
MKLRIKGNSIRMRLTQSEVAEIKKGVPVEETLSFGGDAQLIYRFEPSQTASHLSANFDGRTVSVTGSQSELMKWASSSEVSLKNNQALNLTDSLSILIEKDFFCLKPRLHEIEDESDLFENPNQAHGSCG